MKCTRRKLTPREALEFFAKTVLLSVLIPWAGWAALDELGEYRLGQALDDLGARGYATSLEQLAPPRVAAGENAALFYQAAFAANDILERANNAFAEDYLSADPEQKAELLKAVERSTEVFALLRRARALPQCRWDRDYSRGLEGPTPELPSAMRLSWLLSIRAQVQAENGRPEEARETVRDMLSLAGLFREVPDFSFQWVRLCLISRAVQTAGDCSHSAVTEGDLLAWAELLPSASVLDDCLERGLRAELAAAACLLTKTKKVVLLKGTSCSESGLTERMVDPIITIWGVDSLARMRQAVELCSMPYAEARAAAATLEKSVGSENWNPNLLRFLERPLTRLLDRRAIHQSALALTRAGLEAELCFIRHGHYPVETSVRDEITGEPFVIDLGEGVIRTSGPGPIDPGRLKYENLEWTLLPR